MLNTGNALIVFPAKFNPELFFEEAPALLLNLALFKHGLHQLVQNPVYKVLALWRAIFLGDIYILI